MLWGANTVAQFDKKVQQALSSTLGIPEEKLQIFKLVSGVVLGHQFSNLSCSCDTHKRLRPVGRNFLKRKFNKSGEIMLHQRFLPPGQQELWNHVNGSTICADAFHQR
jgi:hypothetical protein